MKLQKHSPEPVHFMIYSKVSGLQTPDKTLPVGW